MVWGCSIASWRWPEPVDKYPLICAKPECGAILEWARAATRQKLQCPRCRRYTMFSIADGRVTKELMVLPKPQREDTAHMMRDSRYVDTRRC